MSKCWGVCVHTQQPSGQRYKSDMRTIHLAYSVCCVYPSPVVSDQWTVRTRCVCDSCVYGGLVTVYITCISNSLATVTLVSMLQSQCLVSFLYLKSIVWLWNQIISLEIQPQLQDPVMLTKRCHFVSSPGLLPVLHLILIYSSTMKLTHRVN